MKNLFRAFVGLLLAVVPGMQSCMASTTDFLDEGYLSNSARTNAEMKSALEQLNGAGKSLLGAGAAVSATISGDALSPLGAAMVVDTQGGASADDLRTISTEGVRSGYAVVLWSASSSRAITLRHGPGTLGGLSLSGGRDYVLTPDRPVLLMLVGAVWKEILGDRPASHGRQVFTASGTFSVPDGVTTAWVSLIGGGGGGGGGLSNWGFPGGSGGVGGASSFGASVSSAGGNGGASGVAVPAWAGHYWWTGGAGGAPYGNPGQINMDANNGDGGVAVPSPFGPYGAGGAGGAGGLANADYESGTRSGSGGGSGSPSSAPVFKQSVAVTPGASVAVTVGAGGSGGAGSANMPSPGGGSSSPGAAGGSGIVIVEW